VFPLGAWAFRLLSESLDWAFMERQLTMNRGERGRVIFAQQGPARLSGTVTMDPSGPVAGANLRLENMPEPRGSFQRDAVADHAGQFHFIDVPPGTYVLSASMASEMGHLRGSTTIHVTAGHPPITLTVRVSR
jgi:hypothetical protein